MAGGKSGSPGQPSASRAISGFNRYLSKKIENGKSLTRLRSKLP
jgi:hypothetical protein